MAIDYTLTGRALRESVNQEIEHLFKRSNMLHVERQMIVMLLEESIYGAKAVGLDRGAEIIRNAYQQVKGEQK